MRGVGRARYRLRRLEVVGEYLPLSGRCAVGHRHEYDAVAVLQLAIPGAVKGDESAAAIARRELRARVENKIVRRPMTWESDQRVLIDARRRRCLAVAAVFGRDHALAADLIVVGVRPTEVVAL